jgi:hypothetical protein
MTSFNRAKWLHLLHCVVMALLYLCQGLVTGSLSSLSILLVEAVPTFSASQAAVLGLPMYVYSLKFLWAPIVDRCYSRWLAGERSSSQSKSKPSSPTSLTWSLHRRVQYVIPLQCCMTVFFATLVWWSGPFHGPADSKVSADDVFFQWVATSEGAWMIAMLFFGLAFCSATQDISVDAWAVEGMRSAEESSLAGTLQMVGMICGATICQVYVMVRWLPLHIFFGLCGALCVVSGGGALALGLLHHPKALLADASNASPDTTDASIITYAKEIARSPRARSFVWILLTRAWPYALMPLLTLRLQSHHVIDATLLSQVRMGCTLISVLTGMFVAARVVERKTSQGVFRFNSRCDFIMYAFSAVLYLVATKDHLTPATDATHGSAQFEFPYVSKDMYVGIVVVLSVVAAILGAISFVAVVVQASTEAAYFPRDAATTITLFNAMANLGYTLPSNLVMFCVDPLASFLAERLQLPSAAIADRASMTVFTIVLLSVAFVTRRLLLVPSVKFLYRSGVSAAKKES